MAPVFVGPFNAGIDGQQVVSHSALSLQEEVRQVEEVSPVPGPSAFPVPGLFQPWGKRYCFRAGAVLHWDHPAWQRPLPGRIV